MDSIHFCKGCGSILPRRASNRGRPPSRCEDCKKELARTGDRRRERDAAAKKRSVKCCAVCSGPIPQGRSRCCSDQCLRGLLRQRRNHPPGPWPSRICRECGTEFEAHPYTGGDKRFCTRRCGKRYRDRKRTRARRATTQTLIWFEFDPIEVFFRDGWKCRHCGRDTPREKRGSMAPDAPELDHIVPLSRGGAHEFENCQCLCRECNNKKGNRTEKEVAKNAPMPAQPRWGSYHRGSAMQIERAI